MYNLNMLAWHNVFDFPCSHLLIRILQIPSLQDGYNRLDVRGAIVVLGTSVGPQGTPGTAHWSAESWQGSN